MIITANKRPIDIGAESEQRFWQQVRRGEEHECWVWVGKYTERQPVFYSDGAYIGAMRVAVVLTTREDVDHKTRVRGCPQSRQCVNPRHATIRVKSAPFAMKEPPVTGAFEGELELPRELNDLARAQGMAIPESAYSNNPVRRWRKLTDMPEYTEIRPGVGRVTDPVRGTLVVVPDIAPLPDPVSLTQVGKFVVRHVTFIAVFPSGTVVLGGPFGRVVGFDWEDAVARGLATTTKRAG